MVRARAGMCMCCEARRKKTSAVTVIIRETQLQNTMPACVHVLTIYIINYYLYPVRFIRHPGTWSRHYKATVGRICTMSNHHKHTATNNKNKLRSKHYNP